MCICIVLEPTNCSFQIMPLHCYIPNVYKFKSDKVVSCDKNNWSWTTYLKFSTYGSSRCKTKLIMYKGHKLEKKTCLRD